jgi:hypothetical protein
MPGTLRLIFGAKRRKMQALVRSSYSTVTPSAMNFLHCLQSNTISCSEGAPDAYGNKALRIRFLQSGHRT